MRLGPESGRVIGSLIEKQLTTPQQYPLTLNALLSACNQSSNRDPVVFYDERLVEETLVHLKEIGLVRFVHPSHGRSVRRYAQLLGEQLALDTGRLAVLAVLLLRGPQTAGELRAWTERMAAFDGIGSVESELKAMSEGLEPLVRQLSRRPGQKEERWMQLLAGGGLDGEPDSEADVVDARRRDDAFEPPAVPGEPFSAGLAGDVDLLRAEVASLRAEVAALRAELGLPSW